MPSSAETDQAGAGGPVASPARAKRRSIGSWLRWLVLVAVLPGWVVTSFVILDAFRRERSTLEQSTILQARTLMLAVDSSLATVQATLEALATSPALIAGDLEAFGKQLHELLRTNANLNFILRDTAGRQLVNSRASGGAPLPIDELPEAVRRSLATGKPVVSDLQVSPILQKPVVAIDVPVFVGAVLTYDLAAQISPGQFGEILRKGAPAPDWMIAVIDKSGTFVSRTLDPENFVGKKAAPGMLASIAAAPEGISVGRSLEGTPVVGGYTLSPVTGWTVAIAVARAELIGPLRQSIVLVVGISLLTLLAGGSFAYAISRRIGRSIRALKEPVLALAANVTVPPPASDIEELVEIGASLSQASETLARFKADSERRLRLTEDSLLDALESIEHAIVLFDDANRVVLFNQRFVAIYPEIADAIKVGVRSGEMFRVAVERGLIVIPAGTTAEEFIAQRIAMHRRPGGAAATRQLTNGRVIRVTEHPARNGGTVMVATDVTDQIKTETQLRDAQRMDAIGKLIGGLAHDSNNYLGVIIGNLDHLREREKDDAAATQLIDAALSAALRGADLTRSLLAFSRRQPLAPQLCDVSQRVGTVAALLQRTLGEDISTTTRLPPGLWPVMIDGAQLDSCIVNLANNARDAMPRGGSLTIATRNVTIDEQYAKQHLGAVPGDFVLIEVSDSGGGMPADVVAQAFEPFFTTKGIGHGAGLGLSMVYGFVKQSGGWVNIYSEVGHGTTVRIYLPRANDASETGAVAAAVATAPPRGTETILVVEDNEPMRRTATAQLASLGYRVIEAANSEAALEILDRRELQIDLLFTDVIMPGGVDGYELVRSALARRPEMKVLLTSGFPGDVLIHSDKLAGRPALLGKPYRKEELARAIRLALCSGPTKPDGSGSVARA